MSDVMSRAKAALVGGTSVKEAVGNVGNEVDPQANNYAPAPAATTESTGPGFQESSLPYVPPTSPLAEDTPATEEDANTEDEDLSADGSSEVEATNEESPEGDAEDQGPSGVESVSITDHKGRREIQVDFSDKDRLKKYIQMAAGARKWQDEKDQVSNQYEALKSEHSEIKESWDRFEEAYGQGGLTGLIDLVAADEGGFQALKQQIIGEYEKRKSASPAELARMDSDELVAQERKRAEQAEQRYQEHLKTVEASKEQARVNLLQSTINPVFQKYRFSGKLGNPQIEKRYDRAVWNDARSALMEIDPTGENLTPMQIEQAFREASQDFRDSIKVEAKKATKKAVGKAKKAAAESVQAQATSGMKQTSDTNSIRDQIKSGNIRDALKNYLTGKR